MQGLRGAPNSRPRVVLNAVLNGAGRHGARAGNVAGVLALLYSGVERRVEEWEVDRLPHALNRLVGFNAVGARRWDAAIPGTAAFLTGALFSLPRAVAMKGLDRAYVSTGKRVAVVVSGAWRGVVGRVSIARHRAPARPPATLAPRRHPPTPTPPGGVATVAGVAALSVLGPLVFGQRSPFRFASS